MAVDVGVGHAELGWSSTVTGHARDRLSIAHRTLARAAPRPGPGHRAGGHAGLDRITRPCRERGRGGEGGGDGLIQGRHNRRASGVASSVNVSKLPRPERFPARSTAWKATVWSDPPCRRAAGGREPKDPRWIERDRHGWGRVELGCQRLHVREAVGRLARDRQVVVATGEPKSGSRMVTTARWRRA